MKRHNKSKVTEPKTWEEIVAQLQATVVFTCLMCGQKGLSFDVTKDGCCKKDHNAES